MKKRRPTLNVGKIKVTPFGVEETKRKGTGTGNMTAEGGGW